MVTKEEFKAAMEVVNAYKKQLEDELHYVNDEINNIPKYYGANKDSILVDFCSNAFINKIYYYFKFTLKQPIEYQYIKVSDLSKISIKKFSKERFVGIKMCNELKELCLVTDVKLLP